MVPTPPGGTTDIQARLIAPKLGAAPDGHTLLYTFSERGRAA